MPRIHRHVRLSIVGAFLVASVAMTGCDSPPPTEGKRVGNICPEIAGSDAEGKPIRLSDYRGKVVLVNFWGTWCRPCRALIPHEREMMNVKYANRPFIILGVAMDSRDTVAQFLKVNDLPWPNIVDEQPGRISKEWAVDAVPSALLIDEKGVIKKRWLDGINPDEVWREVERAVRTAES
jgi:peroxiredoxin